MALLNFFNHFCIYKYCMNKKLGFYKVENRIFFNKLQAILFANPTKSDISWNFNNEILDKFDWTVEPPVSLDMLYAERARQIREEFDYVILMASGGADSTNMLYSFLNNNLKVDEIIAGAPLSGLKKWKVDISDKSADNTISETTIVQLPLMQEILQSHPNIKITIHDYFEDILNLKTDEYIYELSNHWIHFSATTRHSLDKFSHIKDLAEAGKKVGVVYGIDKPIICRTESGNLYSVITDPIVNIVTPHFKDRYPNVESVLFYYTSDLPHLMIKQAHEVCRWIYNSENNHAKAVLWDKSKPLKFNLNPRRASDWQRSIVPCIYPTIKDRHGIWQAHKQGFGFKGGFQLDNWILRLHGKEHFIQMFKSDLKLFVKNIDMKYLATEDKGDGFVRFYNYWKIGHEKDFIPKEQYILNTNSNILKEII